MFKKQFEIAARNFKRLSLENIKQEPTVSPQFAQNNEVLSIKDPTTSNDFTIEEFLDENVTGSEVCCILNEHRLNCYIYY